jgi:hypothetical protein
MCENHSEFQHGFGKKGVFWIGQIQPSALSETYKVRIEYPLGGRPLVWILEPKLHENRNNDNNVPHTFRDGSVCLHLPGGWTPDMFVGDKIIPWLGLWLLHYEYWLATGLWHGGGHKHGE